MEHIFGLLAGIATGLIDTFGHWGVFAGMIIESACIPLPSEVIMLFGGFMAAQGKLDFWGVIAAGVLGNLVGSVITFWFGRHGGRKFVENYGRYLLISADHLHKADSWFRRYGEWVVFFGRNLPLIRTFISLPAGVARMSFSRFVIFTFFGSIPWNAALTYLGLKLGQNWGLVEPYIRPVSYIIAAALVVMMGRFVVRNLSGRTT